MNPTGRSRGDGTDAVRKYEPALESEFDIIDAPTRDGYTFVCWKGSEYQPGDKYLADSDHVFTAQWKENDSGGGDDEPSSSDDSGAGNTDSSNTPNPGRSAKNVQTKSNPSKAPSTGDLVNPTLLLLLLLASSGTIAAIVKKRKREL